MSDKQHNTFQSVLKGLNLQIGFILWIQLLQKTISSVVPAILNLNGRRNSGIVQIVLPVQAVKFIIARSATMKLLLHLSSQ